MCIKDADRALGNVKNVFMAFNCNIDNIVHVKHQDFPDEIVKGIKYSMKYGASESVMSRKTENLLSQIHPDKQRMGGQIGIMSNLIAMLGPRPIVYTPLLSKDQRNLFHKKVKLVGKTKNKEKVNWIFEFNKGQSFHGVKTRTTNRFIAASRPDGFRMKPIPMNFNYDCAILSGFHGVKEKYENGSTYKDQFRMAEALIKKIHKKKNPVHLEMAYTKNRKIMNGIKRLASMCDSIGLDVPELTNLLESTNPSLAKRIRKKQDVVDVYHGMKIMQRNLKIKKIHVHGYGYYMALAKEDYQIKATEIKKSLGFAAVVATAVAGHNVKTKSGIHRGMNYAVSGKGRSAERQLTAFLKKRCVIMEQGIAKDENYVVIVPTPLVKRVKDIVGLGDIISAAIFVTEVGFSLE